MKALSLRHLSLYKIY